MDSKTLVTLALLDAFGAEQGLLTYFADLSGPALRYRAENREAISLCLKFSNGKSGLKINQLVN